MPCFAEVEKGRSVPLCAQLSRLEQVEACSELRVRDVVRYIGQSDLSFAPRMAEIAATIGISASRLRHLFKQAGGISISRYLKLVRLRRAHDMLSGGQVTVREAMAEIGMSDLSHFGRDYKSAFGETPRETRAVAALRHVDPL